MGPTPAIPAGTVTLLFSDMEGSTRHLSRLGDRYVDALDAQRRILRETWSAFGGTELATEGDSFYVVFPVAERAASAAEAGQRRLDEFEWPVGDRVLVRMGLHTGAPIPHDGAYVGMDVHRAARIAAAAHGGQVTMSAATAELVSGALPPGAALRDLGTHRLKDLPRPEHIYQLEIKGLDNNFPPLRTLGASSTLPLADAPLLGRQTEIDALLALITGGARLVTLTGHGGAGKTSLGVELARALVPDFPDGAYFVPLASVTEATGMWASIAATIGISGDDVPKAVVDFLAHRHVVLVLDNLEQLGEAALVTARLLESAASLCVIATSRRPLHVAGEQEFAVPALALPTDLSDAALDDSPAVQLFVRHARRVRPEFSLTAESGPVVVEICRALDGLPLAIELTAARSKLLSPTAILSRIGTALEVTTADETRPERHRNLRATIEWSFRLLDRAHQDFFVRLGVFADGADLAAVEAVCAPEAPSGRDPLDVVLDIVDASLATVADDAEGEPRVALLETVRAFALSELDSTDPEGLARERHARHYLEVVRDRMEMITTPDHASARAKLDAEHANICAALDWTLDAGPERWGIALELASRIGRHWNRIAARLPDAERYLSEAVSLGTSPSRDLATCMAVLANCLRFSAKEPERRTHLAIDSVEMLRRLGDREGLPYPLRTLAAVERERGDAPASLALFEEVISLVRDIGDPAAIRIALTELGGYAAEDGNLERSLELESEAVAIALEMGDVVAASDSRQNLACTLRMLGRTNEADLMMRQVIPVALAYQDAQNAATLAEDYAAILADLGHDRMAARLIGSAEGWHEVNGLPPTNTQIAEVGGAISGARARLSQADWDAEYRAGRQGLVEDEVARALTSMTAT
jgi:predicted ATPase/class 3 adenylate cyclase